MALTVTPSTQLDHDQPRSSSLATDTRIPILLGTNTVTGKILAVSKTASTWIASVIWCEGTVSAIEGVKINGADPSANVTITHYLGRPDQPIDPTLQSAIAGYADRNIFRGQNRGVPMAYSVFQWPDADYDDFPTFAATVHGESGSGDPVEAMKLFLELIGETVNQESYERARLITTYFLEGTERRREVGLLVDDSKRIESWIDTLQGYLGGECVKLGSEWHFFMDQDGAEPTRIPAGSWIEGSLVVRSAYRPNVPNRIEILFSSIDNGVWQPEIAYAESEALERGREQARISQVRMPGINSYSQAVREATERLRKLQNAFNEYEISGLYPLLRFVRNDKILFELDGETRLCVVTETPRLQLASHVVTLRFADFSMDSYDNETYVQPEYPHGDYIVG